MDKEFLETIEERLEDLPQEVKDFIFGDDFQEVLSGLEKIFPDQNQAIDFGNQIRLFVLGGLTKEDLIKKIDSLELTPENKQGLKLYIDEKIIENLLLLTEVAAEIESAAVEKKESTKTKPSDGAIKQETPAVGISLTNQSIIAPIKRSASIEKNSFSETLQPQNTPAPQKFDPYHEPVDPK